MSIGKRIKESRENRSMTQVEASKLLGVARQTYLNYEGDITNPQVVVTIKLAEIFHVNFTWLATGKYPGKNYKAINAIARDLAKVHTHMIELVVDEDEL